MKLSDTWIQDVSCDSNAVAGQYVRFSATVFSLSPNQTSFWISLYPGEIISLTPSGIFLFQYYFDSH